MHKKLHCFHADELAQKSGWVVNVPSPMDVCSMLAYNDKWWMLSCDDNKLSRYGNRKRQEMSYVPPEIRGRGWYCQSGKYEYSLSVNHFDG